MEPRGFLARLSAADRDALVHRSVAREFARGEFLFQQGEPGDFVAVIVTGTVKVLMAVEDGSETLLGLCGPGELVGELSAISGQGAPRSASVTAVGRVTCRVIAHQHFRRLLSDRPGIQRAITLLCADRMQAVATSKLRSAAYPVTIRIAWTLLDLAEHYGRPDPRGTRIDLALSQYDLAQLVGIRRESVVRALTELRTRQLIDTRRQQITLRDPAALHSFAATRD